MKTSPVDPSFNLVTLANTLLVRYGVHPFHPPISSLLTRLKNHTKIVCLLMDGMGKAIVDRHLKPDAFLQDHRSFTITSTFPSTTAAATNAFLSGRYPGEIGWLGWAQYFPELDAMVELFTGHEYFSQKPRLSAEELRKKIAYSSILEQIQRANPSLHVDAVWPAIRPGGATTLPEWEAQIDQHLALDNVFLYGYWLDPDKSIHTMGVNHSHITHIIDSIDQTIQRLHQNHPDTLFLVFADHGLVDVVFTPINEHPDFYDCLIRSFALEPRAAAFYVKPEKHPTFVTLFHQYYGEFFTLYSKEEVHQTQLYGEGSYHPRFDEFIGDFVAVSHTKVSFSHGVPIGDKPLNFVAHHAGIHPDEMKIQLFVVG